MRVKKLDKKDIWHYDTFENIYAPECCTFIYDNDSVAIWNDLRAGDMFMEPVCVA